MNNPLKYVDPNGKWPEKIHNFILQTAFSGILSPSQIEVLQNASAYVDKDQSAEGSFKHAMRAMGQSIEDARKQMDGFISDKKQEFLGKVGDEALFALGEAFHPVMDNTSPSHKGFQAWDTNFLLGANQINPIAVAKALYHFGAEMMIDDKTLQATANSLRELYFKWLKEKQEKEKEEEQKSE